MEKQIIAKPRRPTAPAKAEAAASSEKLALILVRGVIHAKRDIIATMDTLLLRQKLACSVLANTPTNMSAAIKCKDYVAFGEISEETYKELVSKRGEKDAEGNIKRYFRLHPPRGGFERKGIKVPFQKGGALGYRGTKMNELILKML
jgi:large subunit ribosomal protein L30